MKESDLSLPAYLSNKPWYREPWPWILMAGPAIVVVAGIFTAWLAFSHNDGVVAEDYYKQGLAVNEVLERDQHALALGLRADLMRSGIQLRVLLNGNDRYHPSKQLKLKILHPTRAGEDQIIDLSADGQGLYSGKLSKEIVGRWNVALEDASGDWRLYGSWRADAEEAQQLVAANTARNLGGTLSGR